jgi:XTP/dITP diphosphohydrolase
MIKLKSGKKSVLQGVPKSLPALVKATRIQEKVKGVGFDWDNKEQVFEKVKEEFSELHLEIKRTDNQEKIEKEFGDVLFSMINYARFIGVDPESALERTNKKFIGRFNYLEQEVKNNNLDLMKMTLEEMDLIWDKSKTKFP